MEATATVFFYYCFQGLRQSRPKRKKKESTQNQTKLGKKKKFKYLHSIGKTHTKSMRIHMKGQKNFSFKQNYPGKHIENSVISKYIFTLPTYTHVFVCAYITYLYKLF